MARKIVSPADIVERAILQIFSKDCGKWKKRYACLAQAFAHYAVNAPRLSVIGILLDICELDIDELGDNGADKKYVRRIMKTKAALKRIQRKQKIG